jgi:hypothetical protein
MSQTIHFTQPYEDQEIPVEITWEVEYEVVHGELLLIGYEVLEVSTWFDKCGYAAQLIVPDHNGAERVKRACLPKLREIYDESMRDACREHWESLDDEGREAA